MENILSSICHVATVYCLHWRQGYKVLFNSDEWNQPREYFNNFSLTFYAERICVNAIKMVSPPFKIDRSYDLLLFAAI